MYQQAMHSYFWEWGIEGKIGSSLQQRIACTLRTVIVLWCARKAQWDTTFIASMGASPAIWELFTKSHASEVAPPPPLDPLFSVFHAFWFT